MGIINLSYQKQIIRCKFCNKKFEHYSIRVQKNKIFCEDCNRKKAKIKNSAKYQLKKKQLKSS